MEHELSQKKELVLPGRSIALILMRSLLNCFRCQYIYPGLHWLPVFKVGRVFTSAFLDLTRLVSSTGDVNQYLQRVNMLISAKQTPDQS